jgi:hypothetical protein
VEFGAKNLYAIDPFVGVLENFAFGAFDIDFE